MDLWTGHLYLTKGGFRKRIVDLYRNDRGEPWVKWESADTAVEHSGNGRRATSGFMPLDAFERTVVEELAQ